jgi:hypothetical protein
VVKVLVEEDSLRTKTKNALDTVKEWAQKRILNPIGEFVDTVNGQKTLDEVTAYIVQQEAINTALVARIIEIEAEKCALETRLSTAVATMETSVTKLESRLRSMTIWCLVLTVLIVGLTVAAVLPWALR